MDGLRPWALWVAVAATALAMMVCIGAQWLISPPSLARRIAGLQRSPGSAPDGVDADDLAELSPDDFGSGADDPPGLGIPALALPLALMLAIVGLMALATLIGHRATAVVTGVVGVAGGILALIVGIVLAIGAFVALITLVTLFLAAPFGTLAYLAVFGFFDVAASSAALVLVLVLQIVAIVFLVVAQQRVLSNKRLMFFVFLVLVVTLLTLLLHTLVPGILVSITDALAALITAIVGAIWGLALLVGGIISLVKQLNLRRTSTSAVREGARATDVQPESA